MPAHPENAAVLYPTSPVEHLKAAFVGRKLQDVAGPAAVVDRSLVAKHCQAMLDATAAIGASFRAHIKTHKTTEVALLQVGSSPSTPANFIVSTVAELEHLAPLAAQLAQTRPVSILYGVPPSSTALPRLHALLTAGALPAGSIGFLLDHPTQVTHLASLFPPVDSTPAPVFVKADAGYHRAGLAPLSDSLASLCKAVAATPAVRLAGIYTHHGTSYASSSPQDALAYLATELETGLAALNLLASLGLSAAPLTLSIGATPTALAVRHLARAPSSAAAQLLRQVQSRAALEVHAGVYPMLDMQQLATAAQPVAAADVSLRILAEVLSVYTERERPEALVGAGCLALGREPCKSYPGWGVVGPAPWESAPRHVYDPAAAAAGEKRGWIVGRVAQEHGVLVWEGAGEADELVVGQKVLVWPNHACIASAGYGWYLVTEGGGDTVVDVWVRWRGW